MPPKPKITKKEASSTKTTASNTNATSTPKPNWPLITRTPPASDLTLHPLWRDQILTISNLWTASLCKTYVNFLRGLNLSTTPGKPKKGEAVRVNDRFQVDDPDFAAKLWSETALRGLVEQPVIEGKVLSGEERQKLWGGEVLGLNGNIRIYRYSKGQYFDQHYDDSNTISFPSPDTSSTIPAKTTWTLLLYLTSPVTGCKGGETVFYPEAASKREAAPPPVIADLEVGMALLHRHGRDCMLHEGREVTEGEKWIIRSDLCVKR